MRGVVWVLSAASRLASGGAWRNRGKIAASKVGETELQHVHLVPTIPHQAYPLTMASLTDLFEFLSSPNPSARQIALQNLVGHTPKTAAQRHIFVPSILAPLASAGQAQSNGASGGGLPGGGGSKMTEDDGRKVQGIRDLMGMCRDQGVGHSSLASWAWTRWDSPVRH
jgi:hypothetical protein